MVETSIEVLQNGLSLYTQDLRVVEDSDSSFHYETSGLFTPWYGSQGAGSGATVKSATTTSSPPPI